MVTAVAVGSLMVSAGCSSSDGSGSTEGDAAGTTHPPPSSPAVSSSPSALPPPSSLPPAKGSVKVVSTLTEGLASPWGLAELPGGDLLVSSRDERTITRVDGRTGSKTLLGTVPGVSPAGEGGLLGIAISPTYASDHLVYAYFTTGSDNRIARMRYDEHGDTGRQLGAPHTVLQGIPKGNIHNGGRIAFGPDHMLYAGTGETGNTGLAQDKASLAGKILRMTPDGKPAPGNPEPGLLMYSYGHRNVQGLAWDSRKQLWASEFGQDTWDELNQIVPGGIMAGRSTRERSERRVSSTPWHSGRRPRRPRAGSPSPRARSGWRACAVSDSGGSRCRRTRTRNLWRPRNRS